MAPKASITAPHPLPGQIRGRRTRPRKQWLPGKQPPDGEPYASPRRASSGQAVIHHAPPVQANPNSKKPGARGTERRRSYSHRPDSRRMQGPALLQRPQDACELATPVAAERATANAAVAATSERRSRRGGSSTAVSASRRCCSTADTRATIAASVRRRCAAVIDVAARASPVASPAAPTGAIARASAVGATAITAPAPSAAMKTVVPAIVPGSINAEVRIRSPAPQPG